MIMCEYLLTSANEKPLNEDEHNAIECYREELAKLLNGNPTHNEADHTLSLFQL